MSHQFIGFTPFRLGLEKVLILNPDKLMVVRNYKKLLFSFHKPKMSTANY